MVAQIQPARTNFRLDVEAFTLHGDGTNLHYETDGDLFVQCKPALGGGERAGLVLVELGIDGYKTHRARVDLHGFMDDPEALTYDRDRVAALDDAIEALTAIRDQLATMRTANETRESERNAFDIGADAKRFGLVD